jgi:hypothetical protein
MTSPALVAALIAAVLIIAALTLLPPTLHHP